MIWGRVYTVIVSPRELFRESMEATTPRDGAGDRKRGIEADGEQTGPRVSDTLHALGR